MNRWTSVPTLRTKESAGHPSAEAQTLCRGNLRPMNLVPAIAEIAWGATRGLLKAGTVVIVIHLTIIGALGWRDDMVPMPPPRVHAAVGLHQRRISQNHSCKQQDGDDVLHSSAFSASFGFGFVVGAAGFGFRLTAPLGLADYKEEEGGARCFCAFLRSRDAAREPAARKSGSSTAGRAG